MKKIDESKALRDVWAWKESAYGEVKDLSLEEAIHERLKRSLETTSRLARDNSAVKCCAENAAKYSR